MVTSQAADPANATMLDGSTTSATLELFRAALGPLNTDYYLKAFTRFDAEDRAGPNWNWAACLCTLNWMALRQLWGPALAYIGALLAAALLIFGIGRLVFQFSMDVQLGLLSALGVLAFALPGLFGNALLYTACRKKMEHALSVSATLEDACALLRRAASSRQRMIGLAIGNGVLIAALVGAYLEFPDAARMGVATPNSGQARKASTGKTVDLAALPNSASSAPAFTASALPASVASAPAALASAPASTASAPAAPPAVAASATATPASTPAMVASAPLATASAISAVAPASASSAQKTPSQAAATAPRPATKSSAASAKVPPKTTVKKPETTPAKPPKGGAPLADKNPRFLVNVGLFADENNTRNAYTKLNDAGLNVLSNEITTKKGKLTRIRVGPFATQVEADRAAEKIKGLKLDAVVVSQ